MLARYLRIGSAIELLAALALAHALVLADVDRWLALGMAALLPFAVQGVPLAIEFVTGALIDRRPVARIGIPRTHRRLVGRDVAIVHGVQHRPGMARRLSGAPGGARCLPPHRAADPRLHVQPRDLAPTG